MSKVLFEAFLQVEHLYSTISWVYGNAMNMKQGAQNEHETGWFMEYDATSSNASPQK